jgi:acetyl-CoA carboxylase biotin carboxylase subunit
MGDKVVAKRTAAELGIPCVPGTAGPVETVEAAREGGGGDRLPRADQGRGGGGGRGMKVAADAGTLEEAFRTARAEAAAAFGDGRVYMEKYLAHPRHIEFQVIADDHGNVVHLGERDCSIQRFHQKLVEESPSPALNDEQRREVGGVVCAALQEARLPQRRHRRVPLRGRRFYFIEMNTRLQVEHPVTEMITGLDVVREQIRVAAGAPLPSARSTCASAATRSSAA